MNAYVKNVRIEERTLSLAGEVAEVFVFDWDVHGTGSWATNAKAIREALKREIPAVDREWDPSAKRWIVKSDHRDKLARIFDNFIGAIDALRTSPTLF